MFTMCVAFCVTEKKEIPKFIRKLENIDTIEKQTVTFEAEVIGKPKPHITWYVLSQGTQYYNIG